MYIGSIMRTDLITVAPKTTLVEAKELLEKHRINHLLVVGGGAGPGEELAPRRCSSGCG